MVRASSSIEILLLCADLILANAFQLDARWLCPSELTFELEFTVSQLALSKSNIF